MKVGIDLGTTYSAVARYDKTSNKTLMIPNAFGKEITPSVICFLDDGDILVGEDAKDMQSNGTGVNAAAFKRNMGDGSIAVSFNGKDYTSEDLSAMLLKHLIQDAEKSLGEKITEVVITVPAYFNDFQRTATIRAGESCGVKVSKIINEPTAAAISYGYKHSSDKTVMVYDLGGGTFDITIVRISKGNIEVIGTEGNHILGGKDWDAAIVKYVCDQFISEYDVDPRDDLPTKNELIVAAEGYKKTLSVAENVTIPLSYDGYSSKYTLSRDEFESMTEHLLSATKDVCTNLITDLNMSWSDIDEILLVGGSTRMPSVAKFLRDMTGREVIAHGDTDLAVAKGAAITAELYSSNATGLRAMQIADVTAHSLGVLSVSQDGRKYVNEIMIKRNTKVPHTVRRQFTIKPGNVTDKIEVYTLQGESRVPLDCNVLAKVVITNFYNRGQGVIIDIEYNYDENGVVNITAFQDGEPLGVEAQPVPDDIRWMGGSPQDRPSGENILKNIAICVDLSRSMEGEPIEAAKHSIRDFVNTLQDEGTKFSLIGFGDKIKVVQELTNDPNVILNSIDELKVKMVGRGTDASPLDVARSIIGSKPGVGIIVVLTDGIWGKRDIAVEQALGCKSDNITIIAVGLGEADTSFLRQIATVDDGALFTTIDRLGDTFGTIATAISTGNMGLAARDQ
ncbi:MAG: Hsp70 family protein [Candidatus Methanomethylophilaceae archaeon]|nr:Hsp70 family protein [Candidatus Methanomethylophilaceae archaeon]MBQ8644434.1 Hsp70 family protein [Candidatus Methanomethylophilaceae archaeon]MBR2348963.1 Hsp70 family protein [Candidatus Methanomethylophilaceae archaeon]